MKSENQKEADEEQNMRLIIASLALSGMLATRGRDDPAHLPSEAAGEALDYADALIAAVKK